MAESTALLSTVVWLRRAVRVILAVALGAVLGAPVMAGGYLHTSGTQILDASNTPVRIVSGLPISFFDPRRVEMTARFTF